MNNKDTVVELTVRYFNGNSFETKTLAVNIPEDLSRELLTGQELSDDPISLSLFSQVERKQTASTFRRQAFKMRRQVAEGIAQQIIPALLEVFGVNDELDGYSIEAMSKEEIEFYRNSGRLPQK